MEELIKNNYQIGIFSSGTLAVPNFTQTVFQAIKTRPIIGETPYVRDIAVTEHFNKFINVSKNNNRPFFSFLFYDGLHTYCGYDEDLKPLKPVIEKCQRYSLNTQTDPVPYFNRYKNALLLVDKQINNVIQLLEKNQLLDNTVILITGDHGEEFNDNHLGYWGHTSNFTSYQIKTPLILHMPNQHPQQIMYKTSHYDITPTLMPYLFHNNTSAQSYSAGKNLFDRVTYNPYLILSSYTDVGIVESNRITTISTDGYLKTYHANGKINEEEKIDPLLLKNVFQDMFRFYQ
jgi:membrane-anchored protein YejM (alkaline phosphatase superfamily)